MPKYLVELDDGRKFKVEADSPPTQQDVESFLGGGAPVDSGQSLPSSMLSAAGRGVASIVPSVVGGVGYLTGSDTLVNAGDSMEQSINSALPINPIHEGTFAVKASGAVGQALGMIGTGGVVGGVTKSAVAAGRAMLGQGFLAGARGGGQSAEEQGMGGPQAYARVLAGGGAEVVAERYLFGLNAELGPVRALMGESIEFGTKGFVKAVGQEAVEGAASQVMNNAADIGLSPDGAKVPGLFQDVPESAALEGIGGATFATVNGITRMVRGSPQQPVVPQDGAAAETPVLPVAEPVVIQPVRVARDGKQFYRDGQGVWSEVVPPAALGMPPLRMLDPGDVVDGTLIVSLEMEATRNAPKPADDGAAAAAPVVAAAPEPAITVTPVDETPVDAEAVAYWQEQGYTPESAAALARANVARINPAPEKTPEGDPIVNVEQQMALLDVEAPALEGQPFEEDPELATTVTNVEEVVATMEAEVAAAEQNPQQEQQPDPVIEEPVVTNATATDVLRKLNDELPETAKAKWTPEVYAAAEQYFATGDESLISNLTTIQKRRVVQARLDVDEEARAAQERADRREEGRIIKQEKSDRRHEQNTTFKRVLINRDLEAGFMSTAGADAIIDLAKAAIRAGTNFTKWAGDMLSRFGKAIQGMLKSAWKAAVYRLPNDRAKNARMGMPQGTAPVRLSNAGFVGVSQFPNNQQPAAPAAEPAPTPSPAAQEAQNLNPQRTIIDGPIKALRDGFKQIQSALRGRTSDGMDVPNIEYEPRADRIMQVHTSSLMDAMANQVAMTGRGDARAAVLPLLQTGESPAFDFTLTESERMILASHMLRSGRFSQFGILRSEILQLMSDAASEAGGINREWQRVLDPVEKVRAEATTDAGKQVKKVTGKSVDETWADLENALAEAADKEIDASVRKAVARVRAKLENKQTSQQVADAINNLFFPEGKSLSQQLYEDGASSIASAFFRGKIKNKGIGVLNEGADVVKGELSSLLNEALDALGIEKATKEDPKDEDFKKLITQLGLGNMREGKMVEIDRLVRERIEEYLNEGAPEFAEDLLDQWEQVSATMVDRSASTATLRRVINAQLAEQDLNIRKLLAMAQNQATNTMRDTVNAAIDKAQQLGSPQAGGVSAEAIEQLRAEMQAAGAAMIADARRKAAERKAEREAIKNSPEEVTRRAEDMIKSLERQLYGEKTDPEWRNNLQTVVKFGLTAENDVAGLKDMLMDLGVSEETAAALDLMVLETRRNRQAQASLMKDWRKAQARSKAIQKMVDKLAGNDTNKKQGPKLAAFLRNLQRADEYGVLDKDFFLDAFSHAFELNSLTPAIAEQLRRTWQELTALDEQGRPKLYGMARETAENRFLEAVNSVAPGARWDNLLFNQYQASVLSSISSIFNQFSGIFRVITGVEALSRATARGDARNAFREWYRNVADMISNMPLILTGIRGESLGHLPPQIKGSFMPTEQRVANTGKGQRLRVRIGGSTITLSERMRKILRAKELWTWRTIRGAEAISGITDAQFRFRDTLTEYYKKQGLDAPTAYSRALQDIASTPEAKAAAETQARAEQEAGTIGSGTTVIRRRVEEIIARGIEEQLGVNLMDRVEKLTAAAQFKSVPTGMVGYPIYKLFHNMAGTDNPASRVARFLMLFGRFLGHTADSMMSYAPVLHMATVGRDSETPRNKLIKEIYGDINTYNRQQHGKAAAGTAFLLMNGLLMALAEWAADDDDEPVYQIFGTAPMASRDQKEALTATGKWREGTVRIFGKSFNYMQIPELAALFTALGNASDYVKFGQQLATKNGVVVGADDAAFGGIKDVLSSPIKRSTYRQWFDAMSAIMEGRETDAINNLLTAPVGGMLRVPLVVDADKLYREAQGSKDAKGLADNFLRRIPFVHLGDDMYNSYGEKMPPLGVIGMFPPSGKSSNPEVVKAATVNTDTGTVRGMPRLPETLNGQPVTNEQKVAYVTLAGRYYTESVLRNEEAIRRAFETGGAEAAKKIIANISTKANEQAKKELGLKEDKKD